MIKIKIKYAKKIRKTMLIVLLSTVNVFYFTLQNPINKLDRNETIVIFEYQIYLSI